MFNKKITYWLSKAHTENYATNILETNSPENDYLSYYIKKTLHCSINLKPFLGFWYVVLHCTFILLCDVLVKKMTYFSPGQLCLVRNVALFSFCLPIAVYCVKDVMGPRDQLGMLIFRAFMGSTSLYLNFIAFRHLPLAEATIIMSTTPALVSVMARVYIKEPCGVVQISAVILTMVGVLLSIRLPELLQGDREDFDDGSNYNLGLGCAVGFVVIFSFTVVTLRKVSNVHFSVVLMYFGLVGSLENSVLNVFLSKYALINCEWRDTVNILLLAAFGFLGNCFLVLAIQVETAGFFSVLMSSVEIILSLCFQVLFFGLIPGVYNITGGLLVMLSVGLIGTRKWLLSLPEESEKRRTLRFLLL